MILILNQDEMQNEVLVLSKEQIAELDGTLANDYKGLETRIHTHHLLLLNPLIVELQRFKSFESLKYDAENKNDSIQKYKEAQAELRSFATKVAAVKKQIKGPLDEAGKMIVSIEKSCINFKNGIVETLEKNFEEYEKEKVAKAAALAERRDAEKNKAIADLSEENSKTLEILKKSQLIQKLKFELAGALGETVEMAIECFTLDKIKSLIDTINNEHNWTVVLTGVDTSILSEEELLDCQRRYESSISMYVTSLNARMSALQLTQEKVISQEAANLASTGMKAINALAPNLSDEEAKIFTPNPVHTTNVPMPVPVQIPYPVEVREGVLSPETSMEFRDALLKYHVDNVNSLTALRNNFTRNVSIHSSDFDKDLLKTMNGTVTMAERALEWLKTKI